MFNLSVFSFLNKLRVGDCLCWSEIDFVYILSPFDSIVLGYPLSRFIIGEDADLTLWYFLLSLYGIFCLEGCSLCSLWFVKWGGLVNGDGYLSSYGYRLLYYMDMIPIMYHSDFLVGLIKGFTTPYSTPSSPML